MTVQTPLRVIPINGKRAAYALAGDLRKAGAVASVCHVHATAHEVKVWTETPQSACKACQRRTRDGAKIGPLGCVCGRVEGDDT